VLSHPYVWSSSPPQARSPCVQMVPHGQSLIAFDAPPTAQHRRGVVIVRVLVLVMDSLVVCSAVASLVVTSASSVDLHPDGAPRLIFVLIVFGTPPTAHHRRGAARTTSSSCGHRRGSVQRSRLHGQLHGGEHLPMQTLFFSMVRTRCTTLRVGAAKDCEFFFLYSFIWSGLIIIIIIII
jgi:hypothetical protein